MLPSSVLLFRAASVQAKQLSIVVQRQLVATSRAAPVVNRFIGISVIVRNQSG